MLSKTEAIVLHSFKYGEQRIIVDMFTRLHGRMAFIVSLSRTGRSRMRRQYFQPLVLLHVECDVRAKVQLQKLSDVRILEPMPTLLSHPVKLSISLFTAEFLYQALKGEQQSPHLFDYLRGSLGWLDEATNHFANFHLVLLMRLSRFLGFYPNLEGADENAYFDLREGLFCALPPLHRDVLLPQEASHIRLLMRMDFQTMHLFRMSRQERNRCLDVLLHYYRLHLPDFPELRSLAVMHELFE